MLNKFLFLFFILHILKEWNKNWVKERLIGVESEGRSGKKVVRRQGESYNEKKKVGLWVRAGAGVGKPSGSPRAPPLSMAHQSPSPLLLPSGPTHYPMPILHLSSLLTHLHSFLFFFPYTITRSHIALSFSLQNWMFK